MKVAIVGCGPKGCYAIERLLAWSARLQVRRMDLSVFEPHPFPGAGPAYDPRAAPYLLMNYPAGKIDLTNPTDPRSYRGGSFLAAEGVEPDEYPRRAGVGRYLHAGFISLLEGAPIAMSLVAEHVRELTRHERGWTVETASGHRHEGFDEVLLAVGHHRAPSAPLDEAVAGTSVALQGFGLTAIDLILELTEGRAGTFVGSPGEAVRYLRSGAEPAQIMPWSRSGRPMLVKPELPSDGSADAAAEQARAEIVSLPSPCHLDDLIGVQASLAAELLDETDVAAQARGWLESGSRGGLRPCREPLAPLAHSLLVGLGKAKPGLDWAIGAAWRESYPAIVTRLSHGGLRTEDRPRFASLAAELERLAFGPPAVNAAKLLALAEAGILDLSHPTGPSPAADHSLDARIPPPGLHNSQQPLGSLLAGGFVHSPEEIRGIEVDRSARCIDSAGSPTPGLSATGRITEDWVIGNDTLSRSLHPQLDCWARRLCQATAGPSPGLRGSERLVGSGASR